MTVARKPVYLTSRFLLWPKAESLVLDSVSVSIFLSCIQNCLTDKHLKGAERSLAWLTTRSINSASSVCLGRIFSQPVVGGERAIP